jgi:hypothetical protein
VVWVGSAVKIERLRRRRVVGMIIRNDRRRSGVLAAMMLAAALLAALAVLVVLAPGAARAVALVTSVDLGIHDSCAVKTDGKVAC